MTVVVRYLTRGVTVGEPGRLTRAYSTRRAEALSPKRKPIEFIRCQSILRRDGLFPFTTQLPGPNSKRAGISNGRLNSELPFADRRRDR